MKKSIITKKPNVKKRALFSEILKKNFRLFISTKARKCIMKAGSLDKYLLRTKPSDIDSKFGLYLRDIIKKKQRDPSFVLPYIPGTS
jgi:ribosomal protein L28